MFIVSSFASKAEGQKRPQAGGEAKRRSAQRDARPSGNPCICSGRSNNQEGVKEHSVALSFQPRHPL